MSSVRVAVLAVLGAVGAGPQLASAQADLTVLSVTGPDAMAPGRSYATRATVSSAAGPSPNLHPWVKFVLSPDATITADDTQLCEVQALQVPAGGSVEAACTALIAGNQPSGTYYVGAIVDSRALIAESDEQNNTGVGNTVQVEYPDLTVSSVSGPAAVAPGRSYATRTTVSSAAGPSPNLHPWVKFVLSPDAMITADDTQLCEVQALQVPAGGSVEAACTALIAGNQPSGTYYVGAIVDSRALIAESDEQNNTGVGNTVQVEYPDLTVSSVTGPAAVAPGRSYATRTTVSSAAGPSPNLHPWVKFVLSPDAMITADDTQLCEVQALQVPAGGSVEAACTALIAANQPSGTYYVGAIVDSRALIAESNEENNALAGTVVGIEADAAPSLSISGAIDGEITNAVPVEICYTATDTDLATSEGVLDGVPFQGCAFAYVDGEHVVAVTASDANGNTSSKHLTFTIDLTPPEFAAEAPLPGAICGSTVGVAVAAFDAHGIATVRAGGLGLGLGADGRYHGNVPLALEGPNDVVIAVTDVAGNTTSGVVSVIRDSIAPTIDVTSPLEGASVASAVGVSGTVLDATAVVVEVNGDSVGLGAGGSFNHTLELTPGDWSIVVGATDAASNTSTVIRHVHVTPPAPIVTHYCYDGAGNMTARFTCVVGATCSQCP
jgi:hypothetical protein